MPAELRPATPTDVPELGGILYRAFHDIATKHGFPPDFPSEEFATQIQGLLVQQEDIYSAAAHEDGTLKGSSHLEMWDDVAGIGPISVDVPAQGEGIGRLLMEEMLAHAKGAGFEQVRLVQDSFNMTSLALYTSLGFILREPLASLALVGAHTADNVRPAAADDVEAMAALCSDIYRINRRKEIEAFIRMGFPMIVLDRGHIRGYLVGTILGHAVAESDDDMLALLSSLGSMIPNTNQLVPMRGSDLYRRALAAGHRNVKVMNLMSYGPYEEPRGTFLSSVLF